MSAQYLNFIKAAALQVAVFAFSPLMAQDTTLNLLDDPAVPAVEKVNNAFKTTKVINLQSTEITGPGVFDFKINHRFDKLNQGLYDMFGLDAATVRIGGEFGVYPNVMVGIGRSGYEKTYDGYVKYRFMHQTSDNKKPFSALLFLGSSYRDFRYSFDPSFLERVSYTSQLIIGRKFSEKFSLQLSPTWVHHNMVPISEANDIYALGIGTRMKLTNRTSLNLEWIPILNAEAATLFRNSFSIGFDIETGGHVFQLHFTNSRAMNEAGFITRTDGDWLEGGVHFGFNISRVFTIQDYSKTREGRGK